MITGGLLTLIVNGLLLSLTLSLLIVSLWLNGFDRLIKFFAIFVSMISIWVLGTTLIQYGQFTNTFNVSTTSLANLFTEIGVVGSSIGLYGLTTVLVGMHTRRLRMLAYASFLAYLLYTLSTIIFFQATRHFGVLSLVLVLSFDFITWYLLWLYHRKLQNHLLSYGITLFVIGQAVIFINTPNSTLILATMISSLGYALISFGILRQEIILPLTQSKTQINTMHRVTLAISSHLALETVLNEITIQAAGWVGADSAGLLMRKGNILDLVNIHNLPPMLRSTKVPLGWGVVGTVVETRQSIYVENYARDWKGEIDLPFARDIFGSVICVPLVSNSEVIGCIMVIGNKQGRLFRPEDVHKLELLSSQASVAITHSRMFKQLEESRVQLETVLTSTKNPVIALDSQFNLIFANPAAYQIPAFLDALQNQEIDKLLLPGTKYDKVDEYELEEITAQSYNYEMSLDGQTYLCHVATLGNYQSQGWVIVMNDISELKELDRMKNEMIRMVSHDLKNPLTGAMLYLELLAEAVPEQINSIEIIEKQLERMQRIIRGVLDLEQIRSNLMSKEWCELQPIIDRAVSDISQIAMESGIKIIVEYDKEPIHFIGDEMQFERALANLLENAVKFSMGKGDVIVKAHTEADMITLEVQDNGVGIPTEVQDRVFDRFYRVAQKPIEHISGSGLGLSFVKTIVEKHQGQVWLKSIEGEGTSFFIILPLPEYDLTTVNEREEG